MHYFLRCSIVLCCSFVFNLFLQCHSWAENLNAQNARASALKSIVESDLESHVKVLADDSLEGRTAGMRGGYAAAKYLIQQFEKLNLEPLGGTNHYDQVFPGQMRNLLGAIKGSDPELKDEYILIGAHYDHIGFGNSRNSNGPIGLIHNGADDNASGVACILELAEAIQKLPTAPRRTIIFALWDGEEINLLGSKHWLQEPTVPLKQLKAAINIDMIGRLRNDQVDVFGSRTAQGWRTLTSLANHESKLKLKFTWEMTADSDHHPFYTKNIPVLMLHTGLHEDYHKPSDDIDKLNLAGMERVSRCLCEIVLQLADELPIQGFREASKRENLALQRQREMPSAVLPGRLGVRWQDGTEKEPGLKIITIEQASPARTAGLQLGDRMTKLNDWSITNAAEFRRAILAAPKTVDITYLHAAETEPRTAKVELKGEKIRWGLTWSVDEAEPNLIIISRIVPDTPASEQGLQAGDRIYKIDNQTWKNQDEFVTLLKDQPLELTIERDGIFRDVKISPLRFLDDDTAKQENTVNGKR